MIPKLPEIISVRDRETVLQNVELFSTDGIGGSAMEKCFDP